MKRSEYEARKGATKAAILKQFQKGTVVGKRLSGGDPGEQYVEVTKTHYSISKFLKGNIFGDWSNAENELRLQKELGQNRGTRGGFFVPTVLSNEIIELLKPQAVIRNMPGVRTITVPEGGKLDFNRVQSGPSISWGGENTTISEDTTMDFGQSSLETKKAVCLYEMSRELLRNANPSVDAMVRQELADALSLEEDLVFCEGTGGTQPLGLYYDPRVVSTDLSGSMDEDNIRDAMYQVELLSSETTGWVSSPRTAYDLAKLKDANGRPIFGTGPGVAKVVNLWSGPLKTTTKIPVTKSRPGSNESYLIGGRWSDLVIGESPSLRIETTTEGGNAFADDQVWLKLVRYVGKLLRHPGSFVVVKGISAA